MLQIYQNSLLEFLFIFVVMARYIEILEAILNKNGLDLGHEKSEAPQLPIMEMCDDWGYESLL